MSPDSDRSRVLVGTTVHHADDVRISRKLVPTLAARHDVTLAARPPAPSVGTGAEWLPLAGGRIRRWWRLAGLAWFGRWDLVVLHDPETLPIGWVARLRGPVVFDLHERFPDQLADKPWMPRWFRGPSRGLARMVLRASSRVLAFTLAEEGYRDLVGGEPPVFPNLPRTAAVAASVDRAGVVYVGDLTEARGVLDLVAAAGRAAVPLTLVGPAGPAFARRLEALAAAEATDLTLTGRRPHEEAMAIVARAVVGVSPLHDLPNYRWSPPTKLYEYLAGGVVVVASDLPATREVAEGIRTVLLVPPGDVDALADALRKAVTDPDLMAAAAADAPGHAARWSWDDVAVLRWYEGIMGEPVTGDS